MECWYVLTFVAGMDFSVMIFMLFIGHPKLLCAQQVLAVEGESMPHVVDPSRVDSGVSLPATLYSAAFTTTAYQLSHMTSVWASDDVLANVLLEDCLVQITMMFHTYCDESSWQITRVLTCLIWPVPGIQDCDLHDTWELVAAILSLRDIQSRESVWIAIRRTKLILKLNEDEQILKWNPFPLLDMTLSALDSLTVGGARDSITVQRISLAVQVARVESDPSLNAQFQDRVWEQDSRSGNSMLAVRPATWPETCPTFCLFVLSVAELDSTSDFHRLLEEAIITSSYYGDIGYRWNTRDWKILQQWRITLSNENAVLKNLT